MNAASILIQLKNNNINIEENDGQLKCYFPKNGVDPSIVALIKDNKTELVSYLLEVRGNRAVQQTDKNVLTKVALTPSQKRIWIIDSLLDGSSQYNISKSLVIEGTVNKEALLKTLGELVDSHKALKSKIVVEDEIPYMVVEQDAKAASNCYLEQNVIASEQANWLDKIAQAEAQRPFDLENDLLFRWKIIKFDVDKHLLLLSAHHIVSDGGTFELILEELVNRYSHQCQSNKGVFKPKPSIDFYSHCSAKNEWQQSPAAVECKAFWKEYLKDAISENTLVHDFKVNSTPTFSAKILTHKLPLRATCLVKQVQQKYGLSEFNVLVTAFMLYLTRIKQSKDIVIGTPVSGRDDPGLQNTIGYLANLVVLRTNLDEQDSFEHWLKVNQTAVPACIKNQSIPFDELIDELAVSRSASRPPLVQVTFAHQGQTKIHHDMGEFNIKPVERSASTVRFDLEVTATHGQEGIFISWNYNDALFFAQTIEGLAKNFMFFIEKLCEEPTHSVNSFHFPSESQADETSAQKSIQKTNSQSLLSVLEQVTRLHSSKVAIESGAQQWSFAELSDMTDSLVQALKHQGVKTGERIGVLADRSIEFVFTIIALTKLNATYVPIDSQSPNERVSKILDDAQLDWLIVKSDEHKNTPFSVKAINYDLLDIHSEHTTLSTSSSACNSIAYIMYTSGSTGMPKGVAVEYDAILNLVLDNTFVPLNQKSVIAHASNQAFDATTFEVWGALLNGGRLVFVEKNTLLEPHALKTFIHDKGINTMFMTTALVNQLAFNEPGCLAGLSYLLFGGELVSNEAIENILNEEKCPELIHVYGPTECTTFSTFHRVIKQNVKTCRTIPIGGAIKGAKIWVLNDQLQSQPIGGEGELYISGNGLAACYWNNKNTTQEKFIVHPELNERMYRTGDYVRLLADGEVEFLGRGDKQVKVNGFRIEIDEINSVLRALPYVEDSIVTPVKNEDGTSLEAFVKVSEKVAIEYIKRQLSHSLPPHMVPASIFQVDSFPLKENGKIDTAKLGQYVSQDRLQPPSASSDMNVTEQQIQEIWAQVLNRQDFNIDTNFFDAGGNSILLIKLRKLLKEKFEQPISVVELFEYTSIRSLARFLTLGDTDTGDLNERQGIDNIAKSNDVAIISYTCRVPDAKGAEAFWQNILNGKESIETFSTKDLLDAGESPQIIEADNYVRKGVILEDIDLFDATAFGFTPLEASVTDPQIRLLLESAHQLLELAGYGDFSHKQNVGVFSACNQSHYLLDNLFSNKAALEYTSPFYVRSVNDRDFVANLISYKLNLCGPSININTACSSSLVAVNQACESILTGRCDMALAGGVSISKLKKTGYLFAQGGIDSSDGHCRPFDSRADGTRGGSGLGLVMLKRLDKAIADGDKVHAVIKGSAVTNDGAEKIGFTAPSVTGHVETIKQALSKAGVPASTIDYIEAHGTGTELGDPIEVAALSRVYNHGDLVLGSVKGNIGHLDHAAGVIGLIKATLSVENGVFPPNVNFNSASEKLELDEKGIKVLTKSKPWSVRGQPRRAAVSSLGLGGTNAHVIIEEAPQLEGLAPNQIIHAFPLSANSKSSLQRLAAKYVAHLKSTKTGRIDDIALTMQLGRQPLAWRNCVTASDRAELIQKLEGDDFNDGIVKQNANELAFIFAGQGVQFSGMAHELYCESETFKSELDRLIPLFKTTMPDLQLERCLLEQDYCPVEYAIEDTYVAQPMLFCFEYALAKLLISRGLVPSVVLGHSLGEVVAAAIAGAFSLKDAVLLVATRADVMQRSGEGKMLSVSCSVEKLRTLMRKDLEVAAINGPDSTVVTGTGEEIDILAASLESQNIPCKALNTNKSFHSKSMEPVLEAFSNGLSGVTFNPIQLTLISSLDGKVRTPDSVLNAQHWCKQVRQPVNFYESLIALKAAGDFNCIELGGDRYIKNLALSFASAGSLSVGHQMNSVDATTAWLWKQGKEVNWHSNMQDTTYKKLALPTYCFDLKRYWIEPGDKGESITPAIVSSVPKDWCYAPGWRSAQLNLQAKPQGAWLVLSATEIADTQIYKKLASNCDTLIPVVIKNQQLVCEPLNIKQEAISKASYLELFSQCEAKQIKLTGVLDLRHLTIKLEQSHTSIEGNFYDAYNLVQAMHDHFLSHDKPLSLVFVSTQVDSITDVDAICPARHLLKGLVKCANNESSNIWHKVIDVGEVDDLACATKLRLESLVSEILSEDRQHDFTLLSATHRWLPTYNKAIAPEAHFEAPTQFNGTYIITGGTGGIGLALAEHLAKYGAKNIILVCRSSYPKRHEWQQIFAGTLEHDERVSAVLSKCLLLESFGCNVDIHSTDICDKAACETLMASVYERYGSINGVIHSAGVPGGKLISSNDTQSISAVLKPKVDGTIFLSEASKQYALDFFVCCSSLTAVLGGIGQSDYSAANAFQDAWCRKLDSASTRYLSINWETWSESGMATKVDLPDYLQTNSVIEAKKEQKGLTDIEGVHIFSRALGLGIGQVLVSKSDLNVRIQAKLNEKLSNVSDIIKPLGSMQNVDRTLVSTPYVAPTSEIQNALVEIWCKLFGLEKIGIEDEFIELGGDSLLSLKLVSEIRSTLEVNISIAEIMELQFIGAISELIENRKSTSQEVEGDSCELEEGNL